MYTEITKINFTIWALQEQLHLEEAVLDLNTMNLRLWLLFPYYFSEIDVWTSHFTRGFVLKEMTDTNIWIQICWKSHAC